MSFSPLKLCCETSIPEVVGTTHGYLPYVIWQIFKCCSFTFREENILQEIFFSIEERTITIDTYLFIFRLSAEQQAENLTFG